MTLPDVIRPDLDVLFCGANPGLYATAMQQHFGHPGNHFWATLHEAGFTPRLLEPSEQYDLLKFGYGITNVVARTVASADDLNRDELIEGRRLLEEKVLQCKPSYLAVVGIDTYRIAFSRPEAGVGLQDGTIGKTRIWVLPDPSGRKAHSPDQLVELFAELRHAANALWIRRQSSFEVKQAMFRAAVAAQYAGENYLTANRIVASFLTSGGIAPEVIRAIEDSQAIPFYECIRRVELELAEKGLAFTSNEHLQSVHTRPLEPLVLRAFQTVMHREDERVMTIFEFLLEMMRTDPSLAARLAQHGLDEEALSDALKEK